jgi:hypothetical protein
MSEKKQKVFNPEEFEKFVRTWTKVRMKKDLSFKPLPSGFIKFRRDFDDDVMDVIDFKTGISIKQCFCGKNPHTEDCLTWPHLTLTSLDPNFQEVCIHSLWLEPVEFYKEEQVQIQEMKIEEIATGVTEVVSKNIITIVKNPEKIFAEKSKDDNEKKYAFVLFRDGELIIEDANNSQSKDFIFDQSSGQWILGDAVTDIGVVSWLNHGSSMAMVIEADYVQLEILMKISHRLLRGLLENRVIKLVGKAFEQV